MSNSNNNRMIVFASIMGAILAIGLLALNPSTSITNASAQSYGDQYGYDNHQKKTYIDIQKISCLNSNINVNGVDITQIPQDGTAALTTTNEGSQDAANTQNGNSLADRINFESNLVNICINYNQNEQIKGSPVERTCEECFTDLSDAQIDEIFPIEVFAGLSIETLEELCDLLEGLTDEGDKALAYIGMDQVLGEAGVPEPQRQALLDCLVELGLIITPPP